MQTKPWQIAIIVIGLVFGTALIVYNIVSDGPTLAKSLTLIDVTSGEVFEVSIQEKGYSSPGKNPVTKKRSLFQIEKTSDGGWEVARLHMASLDATDVEVKAVDKETGKVLVPVGKPKYMEHPSKWPTQ